MIRANRTGFGQPLQEFGTLFFRPWGGSLRESPRV